LKCSFSTPISFKDLKFGSLSNGFNASNEGISILYLIEIDPTIALVPTLSIHKRCLEQRGGWLLPPKNKGGIFEWRPTIMMQVVWGGRAPNNRMSLPYFNLR
jgi:hypothetical protein